MVTQVFNPQAVTPGIYQISLEEYHASDGVSKSDLDNLDRSPAHYQQAQKAPREATAAMQFGSALHTLVLEPDAYPSRVAVGEFPDRRHTKAYDAFCVENTGKLLLLTHEHDTLCVMADALRRHPMAGPLLMGGIVEHSFYWHDRLTGVLCKSRPDMVHLDEGFAVDLKSTADASPESFMRTAYGLRYHVQAAMIDEGVMVATGKPLRKIFFVAIEKEPPFAVAVYMASMEMIGGGQSRLRKLLCTYATCRASGIWPGYSDESVLPLLLPPWAAD